MTKKNFIIILFVTYFIQSSFSIRRDTIFYKQYYNDFVWAPNDIQDSFFVDTIALTEYPMQMICKSTIMDRTYGWYSLQHAGMYLESVAIEKTSYDEFGTNITFDSIYSIVDYKDSISATFYSLLLYDRCDFLFDLGYCPELNEVQLRYYTYAIGKSIFSNYPIYKITYKIIKDGYTGHNKKKEPFVFKVYDLASFVCH